MGLVATNKGGKDFPICPAGAHVARCYMVVDLGTQPAWGMEKDPKDKVRIGFEIPDEKAVFIEEKGEEPFTLSKKYTKSTHEKSGLRKDLESWRGKPFTEAEINAFDISKILGVACMINVVHEKNKEGTKTYAKIAAIMPLPKGTKCAPPVNAPLLFDMDKPDPGVLGALPKWIVEDEIEKALNFKGTPTSQAADAGAGDDSEPDDENPF